MSITANGPGPDAPVVQLNKPKVRQTCVDTKAGSGDPRPVQHIRDRFPTGGRGRAWTETPDEDWNDWQWQQRNRVTSLESLEKVIDVSAEERTAFEKSHAMFHMGITPYYAALMEPGNPNCPIRLQSVPAQGELLVLPTDLEDPLAEERDMPVPGITHRYPDRVLFYTTHNCPVYCRHCTRKRKVSDPSTAAAKKQLEDGLAYIAAHPEIRDIVISGGDPLSLSDDRLDYILGRLRAIPHVEMFRLGTRNLVTLPQRVTDDFAYMLRKHAPVFVNTHFNHPKECTAEAFEACRKLADAGAVLGNQMVLLKGVNDDPKIVKELNHKLLMMRVRPYYIYQCDLSQGISHFRTPIEKGLEIIESLRGHTSGLAVPHFVVDAPGGGGKIPLLPEYLVKREGKQVTLRNFEHKQFVYEEP
ncbi:lysine 2,3-aminomutase [Vulgatibacter incomptus]|uniref:L-lysine 2,3-aminomutase n=1 Tax=Vulgatibacter incomptus TaxID=1391653 RepID=A0A0K1PC84_9BACT|nr:lysine 2,3-aminomutase [Vulgatibacter incomptus]AKU90709.1 Lysine 2,3-aminomutase [Vulgatibacter incomptus]